MDTPPLKPTVTFADWSTTVEQNIEYTHSERGIPVPTTTTVWVVLTHRGWGENMDVDAVYSSEEAATAALAASGWLATDEHSLPTWGRGEREWTEGFAEFANIESHEVRA